MNKTILCNSYINKTKCEYKNKCTFAHNLSEQNINQDRKIAYEIVKSKKTIDTDNLDKNIYNELCILTRVCEKCVNNKCVGGYNCSRGAIDPKYQVCYNNLVCKSCSNSKCTSLHLNHQKQKSPTKYQKKIIQEIESPDFTKYSDSDNGYDLDQDSDIDLNLDSEPDNPDYLTESIFLV
jgi:hypothetical protein